MAKKIPLRQCVGCGEMKSKKEMMRVLKTPEDEIVLDLTGKKNGRGAYLCISRVCIKKARKNNGLERSFKMSIPNEVYDSLEKKVLSLLGLAARGRNLVSGEFSTENAVKDGSACLVIISEDASANTKKLFTDKCSFYEVPIYTLGTKEMLGKAIGKEMRASLAVTDPGLSDSIMKHLQTIQE